MVYVCSDGFIACVECFFLLVLCVQDPSLLEGRVTLHQVKAGSVVARQGDQVRQHAACAYETDMNQNLVR